MTSRSGEDAVLVREWAGVVRGVDAVQHSFALQLETLDMTLPYFSVLTLLLDAEDQRLPMSRIARDLAMTSGGFTKLADRMARDGLIDRRGSSGDRRVVFAALTDAGCERAEAAMLAYQAFLRDRVLPLISGEDLTMLSTIASRLTRLTGPTGETPTGEAEAPPFELSPPAEGEPDRRIAD